MTKRDLRVPGHFGPSGGDRIGIDCFPLGLLDLESPQ